MPIAILVSIIGIVIGGAIPLFILWKQGGFHHPELRVDFSLPEYVKVTKASTSIIVVGIVDFGAAESIVRVPVAIVNMSRSKSIRNVRIQFVFPAGRAGTAVDERLGPSQERRNVLENRSVATAGDHTYIDMEYAIMQPDSEILVYEEFLLLREELAPQLSYKDSERSSGRPRFTEHEVAIYVHADGQKRLRRTATIVGIYSENMNYVLKAVDEVYRQSVLGDGDVHKVPGWRATLLLLCGRRVNEQHILAIQTGTLPRTRQLTEEAFEFGTEYQRVPIALHRGLGTWLKQLLGM